MTLALGNFSGTGTAQAWQLTSANAIVRLADIAYAGNSLGATLPPQSVTLLVLPPAPAGFSLLAAFSRKRHAGVDLELPLITGPLIGGAISVEPRFIGTGHRIVFRFNGPVTAPGNVTVVDSVGAAVAYQIGTSGDELTITVPVLPANRRITVASTNVNNAGVDVSVSLGFLVGDMNNSKAVNASDISAVKAHSGHSAAVAGARYNVTLSGTVGPADVSAVKARAGMVSQ